jgi:hypothetical protein
MNPSVCSVGGASPPEKCESTAHGERMVLANEWHPRVRMAMKKPGRCLSDDCR